MNVTLKMVQKVLSANKILFLLFISNIIISCVAHKKHEINNDTYTFKKYKSSTGFSSIIINAYDYENKNKINAAARVNSIYFSSTIKKDKQPLQVEITPNNSFKVEVFLPSRYTVKIKEFYVKRGDSIIINAYLKEDNRPVY
ncbi:hypothetical protein ACQY1Q_17295 [Tenacibaculum sp. TC6]|uniref:hypothetical protein n=1 Tax=Tenacibaculum sp. TC6 TaxID=3423223 RepID=UPI003D362DAA